MKNIKKVILLVFSIFLIYICFLSIFSVKAFDNNSIFPIHTFEIKPEIVYMNYEEPEYPRIEMEGFLYGISGKYIYHGMYNIMCRLNLEYFGGNLDYDGWLQVIGNNQIYYIPAHDDSDDYIIQARGLIGYDIKKETYAITLFTGFAFRYWRDRLEGEGGYKRIIKYWYSPIGIKLTVPLSYTRGPGGERHLKWSWGASAEYDIFWKGKVKMYLSDAVPEYNDPEVDQDPFDGYGLRFSLWLKRNINKNLAVSIEPFVRYWWVNRSDAEMLTSNGTPVYINGSPVYVYEPKNRTYIYGIFLNFIF